MDSNIAIKYTTDPPEVVASSISLGEPEACLPGELVLSVQSGSAKIITLNENDIGVHYQGVLSNGNKGSVTVSSGGEGASSVLLNASSVTTSALSDNSVTEEKIGSVILVTKGGTGQTNQVAAINALLPSQTGNQNTLLTSNGTSTSWVKASLGIDQLNDVNTSTVASLDGQLLRWNEPTLQWKQSENTAISSDELQTNKKPGRPGQAGLGEEYFYVCQDTDKWSRTALQPWAGDGAILRAPTRTGYTYACEPVVFPSDLDYLSVTLLLHMNGANLSTNFPDSSPNPIVMNTFGNLSIRSTPSKFGGGSGYFDGNGDYLTSSANYVGHDLIGSDFTAEAWIYPLSYNAAGRRIIGAGGSGVLWNSSNGIHWLVQLDATGKLVFQYWDGTAAAGWSTSTSAPLSTWSHVAVSVSGSTVYMAVNGVVESFPVTGITRPTTAPRIAIAVIYGENGIFTTTYNGYMEEVRVTKGVARYLANFTPFNAKFPEFGYPRDANYANVSLLMRADGPNGSTFFRDYSPNVFNIVSNNNTQISTARSKFGGSSVFLNGTGNYLSVSNSSAFQLGTGDFSIEFWFYAESLNVTYPTILANGNSSFSGGEGTFAWYIMVSGSPRKLRMGTNASNPNISSSTTIDTGTWYHVAITRQSNLARMWVNGIFQDITVLTSNLNISNNGLLIGRNGWNGPAGYWHGYIDDVRITKGVSRYSQTSVNIAVPTSAYPDAS